MKLKPVPTNASKDILKVVDLYEKPPLIGIYLGKSKGMYSWIYAFQNPETEDVQKLFGNKSLDSQMADELIGKLLHVSCTQIKSGYQNPFGIAKVCEVLDEDDEDGEEDTNGYNPPVSELYPPSAITFPPPPPVQAPIPTPVQESKSYQANVLDRFLKKPS